MNRRAFLQCLSGFLTAPPLSRFMKATGARGLVETAAPTSVTGLVTIPFFVARVGSLPPPKPEKYETFLPMVSK